LLSLLFERRVVRLERGVVLLDPDFPFRLGELFGHLFFDLCEIVGVVELAGPCPPSALMRQIGWVEEGRISGSS